MNTISSTTSNISSLQLNIAKNAFVNDKKINSKEQQEQEEIEHISSTQSIKPSINIEEIQKYANYMGENLSVDDINYGLRYGRSVIVDYLA